MPLNNYAHLTIIREIELPDIGEVRIGLSESLALTCRSLPYKSVHMKM